MARLVNAQDVNWVIALTGSALVDGHAKGVGDEGGSRRTFDRPTDYAP